VAVVDTVRIIVFVESGSEGQPTDPYIRGYAYRRMAERGIPEEAIHWVLEHYTVRRPAPARESALPSEILIGEYKGRRLKVYIVRGSNPPYVKTAVWEGD